MKTFLMYLVVFVGFLQAFGWAIGSKQIEGLGFMTNASPLPFVFSLFRGIEPYSSQFNVEITTEKGEVLPIAITPKAYAKVHGPYNLRNVYGAAIAGAPAFKAPLEKKMVQSVLRFGFCNPATVAHDFGIQEKIVSLKFLQTSRAKGIAATWSTEVSCQ